MRSGFDISDIMDEIIQRAYGEISTAGDIISARRSIYMVLEDWHALQFNTWRIKVAEFDAVDGRAILPVSLDDILATTSLRSNTSGQTVETAMTRISETEYANLSSKEVAGQPTQYVLRRTERPLMILHPKGRSGVIERVRVTYIARPDNYSRHANGVDDLPARWLRPLIMSAALDLASKDPERAGMRLEILNANAPIAVQAALTNDRQRVSFKMRIG